MVAAQGAVSSIFSWMSTLAVLIDYASKHNDLLEDGSDVNYNTLIPFMRAAWICLVLEVFAIIHMQLTLNEETSSNETYILEETYYHTISNIIVSDGILETVSMISQFILFKYLEY